MSDKTTHTHGCSCGGCLAFILFIFLVWAMYEGVQIGDHKWKIGLLPPRIVDVAPAKAPDQSADPKSTK